MQAVRPKLLNQFVEVPIPVDHRFQDLTGMTFGRLTVRSYAGGPGWKWNCVCSCGNWVSIAGAALRGGTTQSCGCLHTDMTRQKFTTHGEGSRPAGTETAEYRSYLLAKGRCVTPTDHAYADYGGRGIEFRFDSYEQFLATLGRRPTPRHTLDRIDVNGHYESGNVRWATWTQQQRNRRNNRMLTVNGETRCQSEWAETYGVSPKRIDARRKRGWCETCAVSLPLGAKRSDGCSHREGK